MVEKEQAVQRLRLEELGADVEVSEKPAALDRLQKFRGRLPENFGYEQELMQAREERYAYRNGKKEEVVPIWMER
jgi:hypothetical protein